MASYTPRALAVPFDISKYMTKYPIIRPRKHLNPTTPPLLALPLEVLQLIIECLANVPEPSLAILRRTHRLFYGLVSPAKVRGKRRSELRAQRLRKTEATCAYIFPPNHLPCYSCLRVRPADAFTDYFTVQCAKWHLKTPKRYCIDCGIKHRTYTPGMRIHVGGTPNTICRRCLQLHVIPCGQQLHICHPSVAPLSVLLVCAAVLRNLPYLRPVQSFMVALGPQHSFYTAYQLHRLIASAFIRGDYVLRYIGWTVPRWWIL